MHFDPLDIVEAAEILDVVAQAIDEKVGGGVIAANGDLVAVAFALPCRQTGSQAHEIGDRAYLLIGDLLGGNHRDSLRHIEDRGGRLGAAGGLDRAIAIVAPDNDDRFALVFGSGFFGMGGDRQASDAGQQQKSGRQAAGSGYSHRWQSPYRRSPLLRIAFNFKCKCECVAKIDQQS